MSLVNQMLRDLELRQRGQLAADGDVLCGIGAVREPLAASATASSWRPLALVFLVVAGVAVLLASTTDLRLQWWPMPEQPRPLTYGATRFESVVQPSLATGVGSAADRHPPAPPAAEPVTAAAWPGLRFALDLGASGPSAAKASSRPQPREDAGIAVNDDLETVLPADLDAVAARFDREFAAAMDAGVGGARPAMAPVSALVAGIAPFKVKTDSGVSAAARAETLYVEAATALARGARAVAEHGLVLALRADPTQADARRLLATVLLQSARFDAAERVLADAPAASEVLAGLHARALLELGREAEALAVLEPALGEHADINLLALHAALMQRVGDHGGASDGYRRVLAAQPGNGVWWMGLGISLEALAETDEARLAYQRARGSAGLAASLVEFVEQRLAAL